MAVEFQLDVCLETDSGLRLRHLRRSLLALAPRQEAVLPCLPRVSGLGFRFPGLGFWVLGFRVLGCLVEGTTAAIGFRV
jgi:hypothetical protein